MGDLALLIIALLLAYQVARGRFPRDYRKPHLIIEHRHKKVD